MLFLALASQSLSHSLPEVVTRFDSWRKQMAEASRAPAQSVLAAEKERIGPFTAAQFASFGSTNQAMKAVRSQRLLINGQACSHAAFVHPGDNVTLLPLPLEDGSGSSSWCRTESEHARACAFASGLLKQGDLSIIVEEDEYAIVCKPAGIHTKPFGASLSLEAALPGLLTPPRAASSLSPLPTPYAVHRLDARVAGLVVVAKTQHAAAELSAAFAERRVMKRYRAIALGDWDPSVTAVELPVDGRPARTRVELVEVTPHCQAGHISTLDLYPETGRRHQLRRHCAELGHPLLGDDLYFDDDASRNPTPGSVVGDDASRDSSFYGKRSTGLFLMSCEVSFDFDGRRVHAEVPEARKYERQRQRAQHGWEYERKMRSASL